MNKQTKTTNDMKKFFKVLLLAAVALIPMMGMAQETESDEAKFGREMRLKHYEDSVAGARLQADREHLQNLKEIEIQGDNAFRGEDVLIVLILVCFIAAGIIVLVLCLRHSRRKAEDHKELINKLIDNNLLNSSEPISKDAIEALMKPKKSDKERYIFDATLLGIGLAASIISVVERLAEGFALISFILAGIGLLRIVTRATFSYFENKNAQKKTTDTAQEAEIVEEK